MAMRQLTRGVVIFFFSSLMFSMLCSANFLFIFLSSTDYLEEEVERKAAAAVEDG